MTETNQDINQDNEENRNPGQDQNQEREKYDPLLEEIKRQEGRFKEGQLLTFVRVRFPGNAKSFPFLMGKRKLSYGQKVVAMSDRGIAVGYVNSFPYNTAFDSSMLPIRSINKVATEEDLKKQKEDYKKQKQFERICLDCIEKYNLDMNLTHLEFTQFGKKAVFYFTAPARVDFRELVKDLVSQLKLRIELRQISLRDRSAAIGGIGPCGRELCCSSFLSKYGNTNIKMAKNQNLSLIYNKLNGVCGQLKCCIQYEDEVYSNKRYHLPEEGSFIETKNGDRGRVERLHLLSEQFDMLTEQGLVRRYARHLFDKSRYLPENYKMPYLDHISDDTATVIGLEEAMSIQTRKFEKEIEELKKHVPEYTQKIWDQLSPKIEPFKINRMSDQVEEEIKIETTEEYNPEYIVTKISPEQVSERKNYSDEEHPQKQRNHNHHGHHHKKNFNKPKFNKGDGGNNS
jgi:cell fate regulator YaaT (PSP1 superfamily)